MLIQPPVYPNIEALKRQMSRPNIGPGIEGPRLPQVSTERAPEPAELRSTSLHQHGCGLHVLRRIAFACFPFPLVD